VNYVCYINFDDMTYITNPGTACTVTPGFEEHNIAQLEVFPNPNDGSFAVNCSLAQNSETVVRISDLAGRTIYERIENLKAGNNRMMFSVTNLAKGIYTLQLISGNNISTEKLVVK